MNQKQLLQKLGKKIMLARSTRQLTQEAFAKQCGFKTGQLKRIENGEVNLRFQTLVKIAVELDVEVKELLDF